MRLAVSLSGLSRYGLRMMANSSGLLLGFALRGPVELLLHVCAVSVEDTDAAVLFCEVSLSWVSPSLH